MVSVNKVTAIEPRSQHEIEACKANIFDLRKQFPLAVFKFLQPGKHKKQNGKLKTVVQVSCPQDQWTVIGPCVLEAIDSSRDEEITLNLGKGQHNINKWVNSGQSKSLTEASLQIRDRIRTQFNTKVNFSGDRATGLLQGAVYQLCG